MNLRRIIMNRRIKGVLALVLIMILSLGMTACGDTDTAAPEQQEQTVTGTGEGYAGPVVVEVTVQGDEIQAIEVVEHSDTEGLADGAFDNIIDQVLEDQSTENVDAVAGATGSSAGIIEAIEDALSKVE
jgi:uncharacterized protein with FMN-binding domain